MRYIVSIVGLFIVIQGFGQIYQPVYQSNNCPCGQGDFPTVIEQTIQSRYSVTGDGTVGTPIEFVNDISAPNPNANYITDISGGRRWMPGGGSVWWLEEQIAHGFIAGDHISWNGTAWEYGTTACQTCVHDAIVGYVENANEFWLVIPGELIRVPAHGRAPWLWLFAQSTPQTLLTVKDPKIDDVVAIATDDPDWMIFITDRAKEFEIGQDINFAFQGSIFEPVRLRIDSSGGNTRGILERLDLPSSSMSVYLNDTTYLMPPDTVILTSGTDTVPVRNWVYVVYDSGNPVLEASTVGWPDSLYAPVATVILQSVDSVATQGPMKNHVHNHYIMDPVRKGIIVEHGQFDRQNLRVESWGATTAAVTTNVGAPDDLHFSSAEIILSNVRQDTFHAKNTATGDLMYVQNDKDWSYRPISNLNEIIEDVAGNSLDEKNYSLVIWGVVSQDSMQNKYFVNLPEASHDDAFFAIDYANYSIPVEYKGSGFLIARLDLHWSTSNDSTFTVLKKNSLLGSDPTEIRKTSAVTPGNDLQYNVEAEDATSPTTAVMFSILPIDVSAGIHTVNPPPGVPSEGDWFGVSDSRCNSAVNNITIDFVTKGEDLHGSAVNGVVAENCICVQWVWSADNFWITLSK